MWNTCISWVCVCLCTNQRVFSSGSSTYCCVIVGLQSRKQQEKRKKKWERDNWIPSYECIIRHFSWGWTAVLLSWKYILLNFVYFFLCFLHCYTYTSFCAFFFLFCYYYYDLVVVFSSIFEIEDSNEWCICVYWICISSVLYCFQINSSFFLSGNNN